jgi:hypothetical protein
MPVRLRTVRDASLWSRSPRLLAVHVNHLGMQDVGHRLFPRGDIAVVDHRFIGVIRRIVDRLDLRLVVIGFKLELSHASLRSSSATRSSLAPSRTGIAPTLATSRFTATRFAATRFTASRFTATGFRATGIAAFAVAALSSTTPFTSTPFASTGRRAWRWGHAPRIGLVVLID